MILGFSEDQISIKIGFSDSKGRFHKAEGQDSKTPQWETCLFCDGKFDLNSLHPNHVKACGAHPKWCRNCNYYFWRYVDSLSDDLIARIKEAKTTAGQARTCFLCQHDFNLLKYFYGFFDPERPILYNPNIHDVDWMQMSGPDFLYPNLFTNICPECFRQKMLPAWDVEPPTQIAAVKKLGLMLGKIPDKNLYRHIYDFSDKESVEKFINFMRVLPSQEVVKRRFGSFYSVLVAAGLIENGSKRTKLGKWFVAKDGHVCYSVAERKIDDWLTTKNILHQKEVPYPGSRMRCDWEILGFSDRIFVEYFGLASIKAYAEKIVEKRGLAEQHKIKLVEIYGDSNWEALLQPFV